MTCFALLLGAIASTTIVPTLSFPTKLSGCDLTGLAIQGAPAALPLPTAPLSFVAIALGTQNYTCSSTSTYTATGAVAELFDISCAPRSTGKDPLPDKLFALWEKTPRFISAQTIISVLLPLKTPVILGQHYFVPNPVTGQGISPKWDFTAQGATKGNVNTAAWVVAARAAGAPAPTGPRDVDWLALSSISGSLATQVYRTDTRGGFPPATCHPGDNITAKYISKYWLYGSIIVGKK